MSSIIISSKVPRSSEECWRNVRKFEVMFFRFSDSSKFVVH